MSRFLPLVIFVIWLSSPPGQAVGSLSPVIGCAIFLGFYALMIAVLAVWSRHVAHRAHHNHIQRRLRRFNNVIYIYRIIIPAWLAVGIFLLGWKQLVLQGLSLTPFGRLQIDLPGLFAGTLPAFAAWMGIWWAQFPADRALRDQNILVQLDQTGAFQPPPSFRTYFLVNLRLQLLFTIAPALLLLSVHDVLSLIIHHIPVLVDRQDLAEAIVTLPAFALFLVFSPEILRRVLQTEPMPDCPLRRRLERIAKQYRVGYREVLLWKTESQMGNAAVMGFVPRFRYVLLSDLLLETMRDEQIEAIFAHEIGHVMHRHLYWLVAAVVAMLFALAGPGQTISDALTFTQTQHAWISDSVDTAVTLATSLGLFGLVFGFVSRKFERQADVFAARTMQSEYDAALRDAPAALMAELADGTAGTAVLEVPGMTLSGHSPGYVGQQGAAAFCTALERVAIVNNIPIAARSWCHGSILTRIRFLQRLGRDTRRTAQFDRFMSRVYILLAACLCGFGAWTAIVLFHQAR